MVTFVSAFFFIFIRRVPVVYKPVQMGPKLSLVVFKNWICWLYIVIWSKYHIMHMENKTRGPNHDLVDLDFVVVDPLVSWFFSNLLFWNLTFPDFQLFWFPTFSDFLLFLIFYFFDFLLFLISYFFWFHTFSNFLLFLISYIVWFPTFSDFLLFIFSYLFPLLFG